MWENMGEAGLFFRQIFTLLYTHLREKKKHNFAVLRGLFLFQNYLIYCRMEKGSCLKKNWKNKQRKKLGWENLKIQRAKELEKKFF